MSPIQRAAQAVARFVLARRLESSCIRTRARETMGRCPRWLAGLVKRVVAEFGVDSRPSTIRVTRFITADRDFQKAFVTGRVDPRAFSLRSEGRMIPAAGAPSSWPVRALASIDALAAWLKATPGELEWLADLRLTNPGSKEVRLQHYVTRWKLKSDGAARLIESPKPRLKAIQRAILREILGFMPPHDAAHGFRAGRSVRTFVAGHIAKAVVVRLDLKDFFTSVSRARVSALFRTAGYPEAVARRLAALCTTRLADGAMESYPATLDAVARHALRKRLEIPHLPQGAPTSPALANLAAYRLDCRLTGLARAVGAQYTRYADDLVFSGDDAFRRQAPRFLVAVGTIALEEGFEVNMRKTRLMPRGVSQRAGGIVLNERPNVPREQFDQLKAILHNAVRHGPATENRENRSDFQAHLRGRIAHVESIHPPRGARLRKLFDSIDWTASRPVETNPVSDGGSA